MDDIEVVIDGDKIKEFHGTLDANEKLTQEDTEKILWLMAELHDKYGASVVTHAFAFNLAAYVKAAINSEHTVMETDKVRVEIRVKENETTHYIDSTSAEGPLMELSNDIYKDKKDRRNKFIKLFKQCYRKGAVKSQCGRTVIETGTALQNIADVLRSMKPPEVEESFMLAEVIELVLKGITKNCAICDFHGHYQPKDES